MRNLKFIMLLALMVAFVSCSSDDDNGSNKYTKENLLGKYELKSFSSKQVKTIEVEGFEIETKTTSEGDTFNLSYLFANNNEVTLNGNFRIQEVKKQGSNSSDSTYIVNHNEEVLSFMVNEDQKLLTIDGKEYEVKGFSSNGFELRHEESGIDENGNSREYQEKMRFVK